uniref:Chemosensory protein 4 n=1 Tax=Agrotis ipsilon TaxID=56364 RepID=U5KDN1_AGRIP|nr:chemosensory protein 4 [Agrotis ipsilon]
MKVVLLTLCFALGVLAQDKYESVNDDFDVSKVLNNDRLLQSYAKCLLNKGPCTSEVKEVKAKLPEALETRCAKCTDKQKQMGKVLAQEVKKNHPDIWKELVAMYDPQGKYQEAWKEFLQE